MKFCSGYSRFGINSVKNLSQKTPWPSKIMGGGGEHCESLVVWPLDFWKVLIKVLNLCYEILRFLKSVASLAQYTDINFNASL